jgi:hypothetical protein
MNRILCSLGALVVLALAACDGATAPDLTGDLGSDTAVASALRPTQPSSEGEVEAEPLVLRLGQTGYYGETAVSVTFDGVGKDSRCPATLDCVERGVAHASFTFRRGDGTEYAVALAIPGGSPHRLPAKAVTPAYVAGYAFRLVRLQPYPGYAPDYAASTGAPVTATLLMEPCTTRCF